MRISLNATGNVLFQDVKQTVKILDQLRSFQHLTDCFPQPTACKNSRKIHQLFEYQQGKRSKNLGRQM